MVQTLVRFVDAGQAVTEAVGELGTEHRVVAERQAVVVEQPRAPRVLSGELRQEVVDGVVLFAEAAKQLVVAGFRQVVVNAADERVELISNRRREARRSKCCSAREPGSLGDGYRAKYCDAARLAPIPIGSIAAKSAGVIPSPPASARYAY